MDRIVKAHKWGLLRNALEGLARSVSVLFARVFFTNKKVAMHTF